MPSGPRHEALPDFMEAEDKLYINGIDAVLGTYLVDPLDFRDAAHLILGHKADRSLVRWLKSVWRKFREPHLGLPLEVDPLDVRQAGWAVVFHNTEKPEIKEALTPLVEHRRSQIGDEKVKILVYREGESRQVWLARHGVAAGSVQPGKVPYYLLLVGSPENIPFELRHQLGVEYAVGSLHFENAADYSTYISNLIDQETLNSTCPEKEALFFGVRHPFDAATQLSADRLVKPLTDGVAERHGFRTRTLLAERATKKALLNALLARSKAKPPSFLFTASHGIGFPTGHPQQCSTQGALLCQDWPGFGSINPEHYLAAADIPAGIKLNGMITFHFACFGAGTPSWDRFLHEAGSSPPPLAKKSFLAALPCRLLLGGALACIGHIERAWGSSFITTNAGPQLLPFENAIGRILAGAPVGCALKDFAERYAILSVTLCSMLEDIGFGRQVADRELAAAWVERNDAEAYLLLGDPATHLSLGTGGP